MECYWVKPEWSEKVTFMNYSNYTSRMGLYTSLPIRFQNLTKVDAKEGDTIEVFCSNTDIEFRTDYNSAKFSGFLVKQT